MKFPAFLLSLLSLSPGATAMSRVNPNARGWCATTDPTAANLDDILNMHTLESRSLDPLLRPRQNDVSDLNSTITIEVYFHTISSPTKNGRLSDASLRGQFQVLQESYEPHGINFKLKGVNHFVDPVLSSGPFSHEEEFEVFMRKARVGGYGALNIYVYSDFQPGFFGLCTLPEGGMLTVTDTNRFWEDGCHINGETIPGGSIDDYNMGYTVVHEVGHWLGLLHTFNGYRCEGRGDLIDDTPAEKEDTAGCPEKKDSCPGMEGQDPIHNYMDYSSDPCYQEFTNGQRVRMHNMWYLYRAE